MLEEKKITVIDKIESAAQAIFKRRTLLLKKNALAIHLPARFKKAKTGPSKLKINTTRQNVIDQNDTQQANFKPESPKQDCPEQKPYHLKTLKKKRSKASNIAAVVTRIRNYTLDDKIGSICTKIIADFNPEYHLALLENNALASHLRVEQLKTILCKTNMRLGIHPKNIPIPQALSKINLTIFNNLTHRRSLGSTTFIEYMKNDPLLKAHILSSNDFISTLSEGERARIAQIYPEFTYEVEKDISNTPCFLISFPSQENKHLDHERLADESLTLNTMPSNPRL